MIAVRSSGAGRLFSRAAPSQRHAHPQARRLSRRLRAAEGAGSENQPSDEDIVIKFYARFSAAATPQQGSGAAEEAANREETPEEPRHELDPASEEVETTPEAPMASTTSSPAPETAAADGALSQQLQQQQQPQGDINKVAEILRLENAMLGLLASLDRGVAATPRDADRVENLALQLEAAGGAVVLTLQPGPSGRSGMDLLDGRWRLLYSSGFAGGNLGGSRPGPPSALVPLTLGSIYQDIFVAAGELDNVVSLSAKFSLASLPFIDAEAPTVTARLKHTFSIEGAATVRIVYDCTVAKTSGGVGGWLDALPQGETPELPSFLQMQPEARAARFDVVFLDERMRITRGDRGELRIFLKD